MIFFLQKLQGRDGLSSPVAANAAHNVLFNSALNINKTLFAFFKRIGRATCRRPYISYGRKILCLLPISAEC
jgi:hypothetical protein